ncbi:MAG: hypothetical protein QNL12_07635 [Acidimicrobiia bacterium]|nr:hypothetical protein [Acidimicrobiia bacterium]
MGTIASHVAGTTMLNILIHGQTASKRDWTEVGSYTKGGDLTGLLDERRQSWMACDLYGHGDWEADRPGFDPEDISDDEWVPFLARSADGFRASLDLSLEEHSYTALNFVTYSMGCLIAVEIIKRGLPLPVRTIVMAVPSTEREYDDSTSLHNNLDAFSSSFTHIAMGLQDDDSTPDDIRWFFDLIPGDRKALRSYKAGHSLPVDWVTDAIDHLTV